MHMFPTVFQPTLLVYGVIFIDLQSRGSQGAMEKNGYTKQPELIMKLKYTPIRSLRLPDRHQCVANCCHLSTGSADKL